MPALGTTTRGWAQHPPSGLSDDPPHRWTASNPSHPAILIAMAASAVHANDATRQKLARGLAINRISFGGGLILAPGRYARTWVGTDAARQDPTKLLARALGARDLALGASGLLALRAGDANRTRRWFAAQGMTDAVDFVATLAARDVPLPARAFAAVMAAGSTAIAAYVCSTSTPAE